MKFLIFIVEFTIIFFSVDARNVFKPDDNFGKRVAAEFKALEQKAKSQPTEFKWVKNVEGIVTIIHDLIDYMDESMQEARSYPITATKIEDLRKHLSFEKSSALLEFLQSANNAQLNNGKGASIDGISKNALVTFNEFKKLLNEESMEFIQEIYAYGKVMKATDEYKLKEFVKHLKSLDEKNIELLIDGFTRVMIKTYLAELTSVERRTFEKLSAAVKEKKIKIIDAADPVQGITNRVTGLSMASTNTAHSTSSAFDDFDDDDDDNCGIQLKKIVKRLFRIKSKTALKTLVSDQTDSTVAPSRPTAPPPQIPSNRISSRPETATNEISRNAIGGTTQNGKSNIDADELKSFESVVRDLAFQFKIEQRSSNFIDNIRGLIEAHRAILSDIQDKLKKMVSYSDAAHLIQTLLNQSIGELADLSELTKFLKTFGEIVNNIPNGDEIIVDKLDLTNAIKNVKKSGVAITAEYDEMMKSLESSEESVKKLNTALLEFKKTEKGSKASTYDVHLIQTKIIVATQLNHKIAARTFGRIVAGAHIQLMNQKKQEIIGKLESITSKHV